MDKEDKSEERKIKWSAHSARKIFKFTIQTSSSYAVSSYANLTGTVLPYAVSPQEPNLKLPNLT